ncbi:MAG: glycerol-3-phosphate dehydrogenase [Actinomycetia bacterium]|nr:glycerol-3-phosphate dehydrogenase [Actinomycetes bacterium]
MLGWAARRPAYSRPVGFDRAAALHRLADEPFDVLVIGGGITGAGVALDAVTRGLRTALVERGDLASGTSSKSSKLVHGGLRYLQQGEIRLVYEALAERQRLRHTAPHLVRLLPFLIPITGKGGVVNPKLARAMNSALWMYDLSGGARIGKLHEKLTADEAFAHFPTLKRERLVSGYLYHDAQTDDARLTMTVARTAADHGAAIANRCTVLGLRKDGDRVTGARVEADGATFDISAEVVVNAAGVWSDDVRALDEGTHPDSIRPAKGVHISVAWEKVRNDIAAVIAVPSDRRSIFVVPMGDRTYIGTTDTDHDGALDDPRCTPDDVRYLLDAMNASLAEPLTEADVLGTWAGLRPLVKSATSGRTADLSRRHRVSTSTGGLVSVTGGKLTTYRRMAADTVDEAMAQLGRKGRSHTRRLLLHGAAGYAELTDEVAPRLGLTAEQLRHLANRHGSDARAVAALIAADPALGEPLATGLPYLRAEVVHAARHEMALTLDDVLTRRIPLRWLDARAALAAAEDAAALMAAELGWDDETRAVQVAELRHQVEADLPGVTA